MPETRICSTCGKPIPAGGAAGLCIACLFRLADGPDAAEEAGESSPLPPVWRELDDYVLLEEIGTGGMGAVHKARQLSLNRLVALKLIKPGMDSEQVLARFDAERQALARMEHPHIARVFDAGRTNLGRPFFVMELVDGIPITRFCDQQRLTIRQRLELFVPVCQAVQHAHQKGIIHRDLKPGNVLVAMQDGKPCPKVIDFGIAKAIGPRLTEETFATELGNVLGTLEYMSPEQAQLNQLDIDTRADIYALGVLLYELLTGTTPLPRKRLGEMAFDEVLRCIREEEPPKPSTRLTENQAALEQASARRGLEPSRLPRALRGDVDWIVMKALEKDRQRRYETAESFAHDVERHLRDEPVWAGPPTRRYRMQKFVRKHRGAVAAAIAFIALLSGAVVVSTALAIRAERERAKAVKAEDEARRVLSFFEKRVLSAARPVGEGGGLGHDTTIRQALHAAEESIGRSFSDAPLVEASVRDVLGTTLLHLADYGNAYAQHNQALTLFRRHAGPDALRTLSAMNNLAQSLPKLNRRKEALTLLQEVLAIRRRTLGQDHPDTLVSMNNLAAAYSESGDNEAALPLHQETWARRKVCLPPNHPFTLSSMASVGNSLRVAGRATEALPHLEEALRLHRVALGDTDPLTVTCMRHLAKVYQHTGKLTTALPLYREILLVTRRERSPEHPYTALAIRDLASACQAAGNASEACTLFEELWRVEQTAHGTNHIRTLMTMARLAEAEQAAGRSGQALGHARETLAALMALPEPETATVQQAFLAFVKASLETNRASEELLILENVWRRFAGGSLATNQWFLDAARTLTAGAIDSGKLSPEQAARAHTLLDQTLLSRKLGEGVTDRASAEAVVAMASDHLMARRWTNALDLVEAALKRSSSFTTNNDPVLERARYIKGTALLKTGRAQEGVFVLEEILPQYRARFGTNDQKTTSLLYTLASGHDTLMQHDKAIPLLQELRAIRHDADGPRHADTLAAMDLLGGAYYNAGRVSEATSLWETTLEQRRQTLTSDHRDTLVTMHSLSVAYRSAGRLSQALPLLEEALQRGRATLTTTDTQMLRILNELAEAYASTNRLADAESLWRELLQIQRKTLRNDSTTLAGTLRSLGRCLLKQGENAEASTLLIEGATILAKRAPSHWNALQAAGLLGDAFLAQKRFTNAEPLLLQAVRELEQPHAEIPEKSRRLVLHELFSSLVQLYSVWGKPDQAGPWQERLKAPTP